jgi:hypothetical protein
MKDAGSPYQIPPADNFVFDDGSNMVFCPIESVAAKSFRTLFERVVRSSNVSQCYKKTVTWTCANYLYN